MNSYKISKLQVTNFRNLNSDIFQFNNGINCILGENGNGKTNILEAINVLCTKKSFRKNTSFPQFLSIDGGKPEIIFSSVLIFNIDSLKVFSVYDSLFVGKLPNLNILLLSINVLRDGP